MRRAGDIGETLIELIVAITIMAGTGIALIGFLADTTKNAGLEVSTAEAATLMTNLAEETQAIQFIPCGSPAVYETELDPTSGPTAMPSGYSFEVTGVAGWNGSSYSATDNQAPCPYLQQLDLEVTGPSGTPVQTLAVAKRGAPDASGAIVVSPTAVSASSTVNTLTFIYTAANQGMSNGEVDVVVPTGSGEWTTPQTTSQTSAGYVTSTCGTPTVSGSTIKVTGVTLQGSVSCTITYGNTAGGQHTAAAATAPTSPATSIFTSSYTATATGTFTSVPAPTVSVYAADGSGALTTQTTNVSAGSTATIALTYTPASGGTDNGTVTVSVPSGWTAPQSTNVAGCTTASGGSGADTVSTSGQLITVSGVTLTSAQTLTITYGATSGTPCTSGDGATATTTPGSAVWQGQEESTNDQDMQNISSPSISVYAADGSGALTTQTTNVSAGSTDTIAFTYTPATGGTDNGVVTVSVPSGWTAPQSTNVAGCTTASGGSGADTVSTSGQLITVSGVTLTSAQTLTITYGATSGTPCTSGDGATATTTPGSAVWQGQEDSTNDQNLQNISSPSISVTTVNGCNTTPGDFTFATSGNNTLNVPAGVTSITYTLIGGGGGGETASGGAGGCVTGDLTVPSNAGSLDVELGGGGGGGSNGTTGGNNGPKNGGNGQSSGAGGSSSDLSTGSTVLALVGGGGGAGAGASGGAGGAGGGATNATGASSGATGSSNSGGSATGGGGGVTPANSTCASSGGTNGVAGTPGGNAGNNGQGANNGNSGAQVGGAGGAGFGGAGSGGGSSSGGGGGGGGSGCIGSATSYTFSGLAAGTGSGSKGGGGATNATGATGWATFSYNGVGTLTTPTTAVIAGSSGNTIAFTYTAAYPLSGGEVTIAVPSGWTTPTTSNAAGCTSTTSTGSGSVTGTVSGSSGLITVSGVTLPAAGDTLVVTYGATSGGSCASGDGATATSTTGAQTWQGQEESTSGGVLTNITPSPSINVKTAPGPGSTGSGPSGSDYAVAMCPTGEVAIGGGYYGGETMMAAHTYIDGPVTGATLATAISGTGVTSLSLAGAGLPSAVSSGDTLYVGTPGNLDSFTVAATASAGATTISVGSGTNLSGSAAIPAGSYVFDIGSTGWRPPTSGSGTETTTSDGWYILTDVATPSAYVTCAPSSLAPVTLYETGPTTTPPPPPPPGGPDEAGVMCPAGDVALSGGGYGSAVMGAVHTYIDGPATGAVLKTGISGSVAGLTLTSAGLPFAVSNGDTLLVGSPGDLDTFTVSAASAGATTLTVSGQSGSATIPAGSYVYDVTATAWQPPTTGTAASSATSDGWYMMTDTGVPTAYVICAASSKVTISTSYETGPSTSPGPPPPPMDDAAAVMCPAGDIAVGGGGYSGGEMGAIHTYFNAPVSGATLASQVTTTSTTLSLATGGLPDAVSSGDTLLVGTPGNLDLFTVSTAASAGATSVTVSYVSGGSTIPAGSDVFDVTSSAWRPPTATSSTPAPTGWYVLSDTGTPTAYVTCSPTTP